MCTPVLQIPRMPDHSATDRNTVEHTAPFLIVRFAFVGLLRLTLGD